MPALMAGCDRGRSNGEHLPPIMCIGLVLLLSNYIARTQGYQRRDGHNALSPDGSLATASTRASLNGIMNPKWSEPYFDVSVPKNVTALVGKSAYLSCRVRNLGNKTVSWIRHRDLHILTVATYTYTTDERFQTSYHRDVSEWTMQIKWAQQRDAGTYECQVSTQPVQSYSVHLDVAEAYSVGNATHKRIGAMRHRNDDDADDDSVDVAGRTMVADDDYRSDDEQSYDSVADGLPDSRTTAFWSRFEHQPLNRRRQQHQNDGQDFEGDRESSGSSSVSTATILGGPDLYVDKGSTINLTCAVRFSPEPPAYIFWYHMNKVISYDSQRITMESARGEPSVSYLLIRDADLHDSGKYSCSPSNTAISNIRVHVLNGERPEAMQTSGASSTTERATLRWLCLAVMLVVTTSISISVSREHHNRTPVRDNRPDEIDAVRIVRNKCAFSNGRIVLPARIRSTCDDANANAEEQQVLTRSIRRRERSHCRPSVKCDCSLLVVDRQCSMYVYR